MVKEMTLRSRVDDLPISILVVAPDDEPKAVLQLAHGLCGCKERYMPFMEYMSMNGIACIAGDHRGHGKSVLSMDDLGYMYKGGYMAMVDDMRLITDLAHSTYPSKPLYLLGHSMGSMAARIYTKFDDSSIDGLILTGCPTWNSLSLIGRALTWTLCVLGFSRHRMKGSQRRSSDRYNRKFESEGKQAWTCSDPEVRREFIENPLCNFALTANGSYNLLSMMHETYRRGRWAVTRSDMPIVFMSGDDDPIMGSEMAFHRSVWNICKRGYTNVTSMLFTGMRHEVLNEIGKELVWNEILDFMGLTPYRG